jgi:hypothetical protein
MGAKYPLVKVKLVGEDGNAFAILGRVVRAMQKAGLSEQQRKEFLDEATASNYDHLLQTVMKYVTVEDDEDETGEPLWGDLGESEE